MKVSELDDVPLMERISQRVPPCRRDVGVGGDVVVLDLKRGMCKLAIAIFRWKEFIFSVGLSPPINWGAMQQPSITATLQPNEGLLSTCWFRWRCLQTWRSAGWRLVCGGLREEAARHGGDIVGGNMSRTEGPIVVELFLLDRLVLAKNNEAKERGERRPTQ